MNVRANAEEAKVACEGVVEMFTQSGMNAATQLHACMMAISMLCAALKIDRAALIEKFRRIIDAPIDLRDQVAETALIWQRDKDNVIKMRDFRLAVMDYEAKVRQQEPSRIITP